MHLHVVVSKVIPADVVEVVDVWIASLPWLMALISHTHSRILPSLHVYMRE